MTTSLTYSTTPISVIYISSKIGGNMIPVPVLEYSLTRSGSDAPDQLVFTCLLDQFPSSLFTELFIADGRSGKFIVECYTKYGEPNTPLFIQNSDGEWIYNPKVLSELKDDKYLRFYGLLEGPKLDVGMATGNKINFTALDVSSWMRNSKILSVWNDRTCVEIIQDIISNTPLNQIIKIAPRVDATLKMGQKGNKNGFRYIAKAIPRWNVIVDAAKRLGEVIRVRKREIQIGRFTPDVNSFTYYYGKIEDNIDFSQYTPTMDQTSFMMEPQLEDEDIVVICYNYVTSKKTWDKQTAAQYTHTYIEEFAKEANDKPESSSDKAKYNDTKFFRFYFNDYDGDLKAQAERLLSNIIYKRWSFTFTTLGNPIIDIDDIIIIKKYFGGEDFEKIKWRCSHIEEKYNINGYTTILQCEGVLMDNIASLEYENHLKPFSTPTQFPGNTNNSDNPNGGGTDKPMPSNPINPSSIPVTSTPKTSTSAPAKYVKRTITSPYGWRISTNSFHDGIDFGFHKGDNLTPAFGGTVVNAQWNGGYGNYIMIKHSDGYYTFYGHLDSILVGTGQVVTSSTIIGKTGQSGGNYASHLHYGTRNSSGQSINPATYGGPVKE